MGIKGDQGDIGKQGLPGPGGPPGPKGDVVRHIIIQNDRMNFTYYYFWIEKFKLHFFSRWMSERDEIIMENV